ncbi:MAG: hypothetical protein FWD56_08200, partial [Bacteroidales bacterium]|nr:hypothetical protein [Bacteroidales bacterium]
GLTFTGGPFPDSAIIAGSVLLPSGEMEMYRGQHRYSFLSLGSTITSYNNEILLLNYDYSDTLFTLKDNRLNPLYVLRLSDKMTGTAQGGSGCEIISVYNRGIVLSKNKLEYYNRTPRTVGVAIFGREFVLLDREGNVFRIDDIHVMDTQINLSNTNPSIRQLSSFLPIICGKYGYMLFEHDVLATRPANFDPDNDNPIIIVGELK